ncbi:hypothetical protein HYW21_09230 [Candidatus Woesearchaeota archaeon]|nr:hypothetical protein [Candidatus Woesearchaeota archaeon]
MDQKLLQEIGLTTGETKVYLALLHLGETKTGPLAKEAQVSSSKVYKILDRLMKKGLAGYMTKGKIKYFTGVEPKRILDYIEEREKELQRKKELVKQIIPQLEIEQQLADKRTKATLYEGFKAISNFYRQILSELKASDHYFVLGAQYGEEMPGVRAFFHNYHTQRIKKKIKVKMLANFGTRDNLEPPTFVYADVRFLPEYLVPKMTVVFYRNKTFIFFLTKNPQGFLLESEEVTKSFKIYFETLWKMSTKTR